MRVGEMRRLYLRDNEQAAYDGREMDKSVARTANGNRTTTLQM
jgi:hypothetical protein